VTIRDLIVEMAADNPTGPWTTQAARNLFVRHDERLGAARALVRDRGSQFIDSFEIFRTEGLRILRTPVRTPAANTFAERWIGTLRRELLDCTIIWNHRQLERLVVDYVAHYNGQGPHRSLDQQPPRPDDPDQVPHPNLRVLRTNRCDGLINEHRNAAEPATTQYRAPTGVTLRYDASGTVTVRAQSRGESSCRRGDLNPHALAGTSPSS
jgi:putative transposase